MVYPNDYLIIKEELEERLKKRGTLVSYTDALEVPTGTPGLSLWATFSPAPDADHAIVRFWVVDGQEVHEVCGEIVFEDRLYHEGWSWYEAARHPVWTLPKEAKRKKGKKRKRGG